MKRFLSVVLSLSLVVSPMQASVCSATDEAAVQRNVTEIINKLPEKLRVPLYKFLNGDPTWNATDLSLNETEAHMLREALKMFPIAAGESGVSADLDNASASGHSDFDEVAHEYPSGLKLIDHRGRYKSKWEQWSAVGCVNPRTQNLCSAISHYSGVPKFEEHIKVGARDCRAADALYEIAVKNYKVMKYTGLNFSFSFDDTMLPLEVKQVYNTLRNCSFTDPMKRLEEALAKSLVGRTFDCGNDKIKLLMKDISEVVNGVRMTALGYTRSDDKQEDESLRRIWDMFISCIAAVVFVALLAGCTAICEVARAN